MSRKLQASDEPETPEQSPLVEEDPGVHRVRLAAAKIITILWRREAGNLEVEKCSVYGSALVMPQVARSAGWPKELVQLMIRCYTLLFLAIFLQSFLVMLLNKEEAILDKFSGAMYLCDLGAHMSQCPDGVGCTGPGGTLYEPSRLYGWADWVMRQFVRDSMIAVFPDKEDHIRESVDPGEFGVESHPCRLICVFLFIISLTGEMEGIRRLWNLLYNLPSAAEPWLDYEVPDWDPDKEKAKALRRYSELELVKLQVAGMPMVWKAINFCLLLLPKSLVWISTLRAGTNFLMETSGINSTIVNSTALAFILNIDELLFTCMSTNATQYILENMEGKHFFDQNKEENKPDDEVLQDHSDDQRKPLTNFMVMMVPSKMVVAIALAVGIVCYYYWDNCKLNTDGTWVSKDMFLPKGVEYGFLEAFFPMFFEEELEETPYWTMPKTPPH